MTADVELLPLPDVRLWRAMKDRNGNVGYSDKPDPKYSESATTDGLTWVRLNDHTAAMQAYARANVAHATAAKDAEIARLNEAFDTRERMLADIEQAHAVEIEALRAEVERLAEALRDALECGDDGDWEEARRYIAKALNPTAAQEDRDE